MRGRLNTEFHSKREALEAAHELAEEHGQPFTVWQREDGRYMVTFANRRPIILQWRPLGVMRPPEVATR